MKPREQDGRAAEQRLAGYFRTVAGRLRARYLLVCAMAGVSAALVPLAVGAWARGDSTLTIGYAAATAVAVAAAGIAGVRRRWSPPAAADAVERVRPESKNVVVTARELLERPDRARPWVRERVFGDALRIVRDTPPRDVVSVARPATACAAVLLVASIVGAAGWKRSQTQVVRQVAHRMPSAAVRIVATIEPPGYTGATPQRLENPDRIEGLQGSRVTLLLQPGHDDWRVRFGRDALSLVQHGQAMRAETRLTTSGYFAIERESGNDGRLIPVAVTPDRAPTIRIDRPGKDLTLRDATGVVPITAVATDDYGLASLELRYTTTSGSGERFDFQDGRIPLDLRREGRREWEGRGVLDLKRLGLEPGASLVYQVVARDDRPGDGGVAASDTFFVELAAPGQTAFGGLDLPPDRDRYALSQQMIVLGIERLDGQRRAMTPEAVRERAETIAAEQRAVRSNFIFLLGGRVEDEAQEAEQSHEIQEGRLENTARREINQAIDHMTRTEQSLVAANTSAALPEARAAARALQRAFGRNRYILRPASGSGRIDPARRLSGNLEGVSSSSGGRLPPAPAASQLAAHAILTRLIALAPAAASADTSAARELSLLAEQALAVDPASRDWRTISARLVKAREAIAARQARDAIAARLNAALALVLTEAARQSVPALPAAAEPALRSAWTEAHRR